MRYFTVLLLLFSFSLRGQTMRGIVLDGSTGKPLWPVTVVNLTTQQAVLTSDNGYYEIPANKGDVVTFSYIGYSTLQKIMSSLPNAILDITMTHTDFNLPEFNVRPGHLTQYQMDSFDRATIYKVPLQRRPPNPFMSPVSAIAEKFSRHAKQVYKFQKVFAAGEKEKFIDTRYSPELVTQLTGFTGDTIGHFMYAYPMPYDFARTASDLEIKMWIRSNYKEWMKKGMPLRQYSNE